MEIILQQEEEDLALSHHNSHQSSEVEAASATPVDPHNLLKEDSERQVGEAVSLEVDNNQAAEEFSGQLQTNLALG